MPSEVIIIHPNDIDIYWSLLINHTGEALSYHLPHRVYCIMRPGFRHTFLLTDIPYQKWGRLATMQSSIWMAKNATTYPSQHFNISNNWVSGWIPFLHKRVLKLDRTKTIIHQPWPHSFSAAFLQGNLWVFTTFTIHLTEIQVSLQSSSRFITTFHGTWAL